MPARIEPNPSRGSRSLVTTLTIAFVLLSVIPLLLTSSLQLFFNFQAQQQAIFDQQRLIAAESASEVSAFVEQIFKGLETGSRFTQVSDPAQQRLVLEKLLGLEDALREVVLLDQAGQEVARVSRRSSSAASLQNLAESELFAQASQGQRFISPVHFDETTSEPLVVVAVPVNDVFGDFVGALAAEVNLKFMWDLVDRLRVGQTGAAFVVDRQGNLIAFGDAARVLKGENLSQLTEVAEFVGGQAEDEQELYSTGINGAAVVGTYAPLGTPDWAVVTEMPVAEAYQNVIRSLTIYLGVLVAVGLVAAGAGIYASRYLTRPLLNLTQTATRLAAGETGLQAAPEGPAEVERLASAFNHMTAQLQEFIGTLEQRVSARTRRLETVAVLSERLAAILHLDELLAELVDQVKANFGYYHAHIYLLDDRREQLVVAAGTGEAGAAMKAKGHQIALNAPASLVARAARSGETVQVDNVREAPDWLPNPLLPDTYSEMAVPIILAGQVVGVLDVQQDKVAGLDEGDANLLRSLAGQVAVAIRNARLFTEVNTALAEARASQERYIEQAWQKTRIASRFLGHHLYIKPGAEPLDEAKQQALSIVRQQAQRQSHPTVVAVDDDERASSLVAPINLREKTIGALQLYTVEPDRSWSEDDLAVIEAVVDQFAETAENLRLFEETRERAGRERVIREITDKLRAAPNLERLVKIAAEELGQRLSASHAKLELGLERDRPVGRMHAGQQG